MDAMNMWHKNLLILENVQKYGSLFLNVFSSVGLILVNKHLVYMKAGFRFGTFLTFIHFIISFLGCLLFAKLGFFTVKQLSIVKVLPISAAFCGYVVFNNLSLMTNTVSVYQISKILCTPVIVWLEYVHYHKRERRETLLSLVPVCTGVAFTVYSDADLNVVGSIWALLAIVANSLYTIWGKRKQEELGTTPMQLLLYQAPLSALMLLFVIPFDDSNSLMMHNVTFTTVWTIALSCLLAFGVNFSFFLFVRETSPLTMNIVGYLKTSLVLLSGFVFVTSEIRTLAVFGVLLTLLGLAFYTLSKIPGKISHSSSKVIV